MKNKRLILSVFSILLIIGIAFYFVAKEKTVSSKNLEVKTIDRIVLDEKILPFKKKDLITGEMVDSKKLENKPTIISFFEMSCTNCSNESLDLFADLKEKYDINVILVALSGDEEEIVQFLKDKKLVNLSVIKDYNRELASKFLVTQTPNTAFFDSKLHYLGSVDYILDQEKLEDMIEKLH